MDNILKLIVGCLGLVGLIVMIVPNSDPIAKSKAKNAVEAAPTTDPAAAGTPPPPPPPPDPNAAAQTQADADNVIVEDYDIGSFGQPMIDPTPPGQRNQQVAQQLPQQYNGGVMPQNGVPGQTQTGAEDTSAQTIQPQNGAF